MLKVWRYWCFCIIWIGNDFIHYNMHFCNMQTLIVQPKNRKELAAVKAALKALGVSFKKEEVGSYDPEFVARIERSKAEVRAGKTTTVKPEDLKNFLGL